MSYIVIFLLLFEVFLVLKNYKSKVTWYFTFMMLGLELSILITIVYIAKFGQYPYPQSWLYKLDYLLYLRIHSVRLEYYTLMNLLNIGICLYVFMVPLFVYSYTCKTSGRSVLFNVIITAGLLVMPICSVIFYNADMSMFFYKQFYSLSDAAQKGEYLFKIYLAESFDAAWKICYLFVPILFLLKNYLASKLRIKKNQIFAIMICLLILNMTYLSLLVLGNFAPNYVECTGIYTNTMLPELSNSVVKHIFGLTFVFENQIYLLRSVRISTYCYTVVPIAVLGMVGIMIFTMIKYKGVDNVDIFRHSSIKRNTKTINKDLRGVLHSFKNILFGIDATLKSYHIKKDPQKKELLLKDVEHFVQASIEDLSDMMNKLKDFGIFPKEKQVREIVDKALKELFIPENIKVEKIYSEEQIVIYVDEFCMVNALQNILKNAVEAIAASKKTNGVITVEFFAEQDWAAIKITDNGVGIPKEDYNNIFKDFYTNKSRSHNNWGVGLSYVYRVVKKHLGYISVESKLGEKTTFCILLPKGRVGHGKNKGYAGRRLRADI